MKFDDYREYAIFLANVIKQPCYEHAHVRVLNLAPAVMCKLPNTVKAACLAKRNQEPVQIDFSVTSPSGVDRIV